MWLRKVRLKEVWRLALTHGNQLTDGRDRVHPRAGSSEPIPLLFKHWKKEVDVFKDFLEGWTYWVSDRMEPG